MLERLEEISNSIRGNERLCEYSLLAQFYKILSFYGFPVLIQELNVMSGFSLRFLYQFDFQNAYNEDLNFMRDNLLNNIGVELSIVESTNLEEFVTDRIRKGIPLILHPENILVYKVEPEGFYFFRNFFIESASLNEIMAKNNKAILIKKPESFKRENIYDVKMFIDIFKQLSKNFNGESLIINGREVFQGEKAYVEFIRDLRDEKKEFNGIHREWFNIPAYEQWTSVYGLISYFLGVYHFLDRKKQKEGIKIIRNLEDLSMYWREWGRIVGRGSNIPYSRIVPYTARRSSANSLEKGLKALRFVVNGFLNII
jgi:hypothetical protein